jgi:hypothetical protein
MPSAEKHFKEIQDDYGSDLCIINLLGANRDREVTLTNGFNEIVQTS